MAEGYTYSGFNASRDGETSEASREANRIAADVEDNPYPSDSVDRLYNVHNHEEKNALGY